MRALAAVLVLLLAPATALASRAPSSAEKRAIKHAVSTSPKTDAVGCVRTTGIRISTKGPWAKGVARPCEGGTDAAAVVLKRTSGTWHVRTIGTAQVGCGVPRKVRKDLKLFC